MPSKYSVSLAKFLKDLQMETLFLPKAPDEIFISSPDVNRPGLFISGYENFFYLYNPLQPICRGNVGKGCDLSSRNGVDPFDELVNACSDFLK